MTSVRIYFKGDNTRPADLGSYLENKVDKETSGEEQDGNLENPEVTKKDNSQDGQRAKDQESSNCCKEELQLQPVQLIMQESFSLENPQANSQRRETLCLFPVQLYLHNS